MRFLRLLCAPPSLVCHAGVDAPVRHRRIGRLSHGTTGPEAGKMRIPLLMSIAIAVAVLGCAMVTAQAAQKHATVTGKVTDESGAAVPNADVYLRPEGCKCAKSCPDDPTCSCCPNQIRLKSDSKGKFKVSVPQNDYVLTVDSAGKKSEMKLDLTKETHKKADITVQ